MLHTLLPLLKPGFSMAMQRGRRALNGLLAALVISLFALQFMVVGTAALVLVIWQLLVPVMGAVPAGFLIAFSCLLIAVTLFAIAYACKRRAL